MSCKQVAQLRKQVDDKQRELDFARLEKAEAARAAADREQRLRNAEEKLSALRRQIEAQVAEAAQRQLEARVTQGRSAACMGACNTLALHT
jgi:hypothetical protein